MPQLLHEALRAPEIDAAEALGLAACIECGLCDVACPSHIPLAQGFRQGKARLRAERQRQHEAREAQARFEAREQRLERERAALAERRAVAGKEAAAKAALATALAKARARSAARPAPDRSE